jgi:hypothetical protein
MVGISGRDTKSSGNTPCMSPAISLWYKIPRALGPQVTNFYGFLLCCATLTTDEKTQTAYHLGMQEKIS